MQTKSFVHLFKIALCAVMPQFFTFTFLELSVRYEFFPQSLVKYLEILLSLFVPCCHHLTLIPMVCFAVVKDLQTRSNLTALLIQCTILQPDVVNFFDRAV